MNPTLLALLARAGRLGTSAFQGRNLGSAPSFSGGDLGPAVAGFDMPEAAMERMQAASDARQQSPHHRIMGAFDDMLASRKGDSLTSSPQHMIEKGFNDVSMSPPSAGMPWWMQQPQAQAPQAPVSAQGASQQLPLPPEQRPVHDMPSAQVPLTPFNPAPVAPPELSWFQRNGMMQRDNETGNYLDPQMAQRAQSAGGLFG